MNWAAACCNRRFPLTASYFRSTPLVFSGICIFVKCIFPLLKRIWYLFQDNFLLFYWYQIFSYCLLSFLCVSYFRLFFKILRRLFDSFFIACLNGNLLNWKISAWIKFICFPDINNIPWYSAAFRHTFHLCCFFRGGKEVKINALWMLE